MENLSEVLHKQRFLGDDLSFSSLLNANERLPTSVCMSAKLEGHRGCINTCAFNPMGDHIITGCDDGCVWLWDINNKCKHPTAMLRPHATNVFTANFLSSNKFVSGGNDSTIQVVEVTESGAVSTQYESHHLRKVLSSFVIDDHTFATCSADETIRLFDTRQSYPGTSTRELPLLTDKDMQYNGQQRLSDDIVKYNLLPQSHGGGKVGKLSPSHDESLLLDLRGTGAQFFQMDVHPIDRRRFLASCGDGTVRLYDLRSIGCGNANIGFSVREAYGGEMEVTGAAFDDTGDRIAATVLQGDIHVFETECAQELKKWTPPIRHSRGADCEVHITDFIRLDGSLDVQALQRTLDAQQASEEMHEEEEEEVQLHGCIQVLKGHRSFDTIKAVNWFGDYVVTGSDNAIIYLYNVKTGKVCKVLKGHNSHVNVVAVHREKKLLATSGIDDFAILWEPDAFTEYDDETNQSEITEAIESARNTSGMAIDCNVM